MADGPGVVAVDPGVYPDVRVLAASPAPDAAPSAPRRAATATDSASVVMVIMTMMDHDDDDDARARMYVLPVYTAPMAARPHKPPAIATGAHHECPGPGGGGGGGGGGGRTT